MVCIIFDMQHTHVRIYVDDEGKKTLYLGEKKCQLVKQKGEIGEKKRSSLSYYPSLPDGSFSKELKTLQGFAYNVTVSIKRT